MEIFRYILDRWRTLHPAPDYRHTQDNPLRLFASINRRQWGYFLVGLFAWTWDAFDFHTVTITYPELSRTFNKTVTEISLGVSFVMMFRPLGAAVFGLAADYYGRQWPFIINNIFLIAFELATGFCQTYRQFLAVRAMFGFAMGGIWGNAAATALEDLPNSAKGLMSGLFQSGYPFGYLLAIVFWKVFDQKTRHEWRVLFWFGAIPPVFLIIARCCMDETQAFRSRKRLRECSPTLGEVLEDVFVACKDHWDRLSYLVILMTGFGFMSHGLQDIYPLMLQNKYNFSSSQITHIQVTASIGGIAGSVLLGYFSQIFGRRFTIICACILGGMLLYPYTFSTGSGLYAAAFFELFCALGAWGVVPIHLMEVSPPAYRTLMVGSSYHLGIMVSAASNSIETALGERYPLPPRNGEVIYDYSLVICIFAACVYGYVAIVACLGPEERGVTLRDGANDAAENANAPGQLQLDRIA